MAAGSMDHQAGDMEPTSQEPNTPPPPPDAGSTRPDGPAVEADVGDRLHRCRRGRMLAGVAGGVAEYFDIDPTVVRVAFVAATLLGALAVPLYVAGWFLIPEEGAECSVAEDLLGRDPLGPHRAAA